MKRKNKQQRQLEEELKLSIEELKILSKEKRSRWFFARLHLLEKIRIYFKSINFNEECTPSELIYFLKNDIKKYPRCYCGNKTKKSANGPFRIYCSAKCSANSDKTIKKRETTTLERYNCTNVFQSKEIKEKITNTLKEHYGVSHHMKLDKYKNMSREVFKKADYSNAIKKHYITTYKKFKRFEDKVIPLFNADEFKGTGYNKLYNWKCIKCNKSFLHWYHNGEMPKCPICKKEDTKEGAIGTFLKSLNLNFIQNTRSVIPPLELDFYFPDKKIAIEFNGNYWHSELRGITKNYHLNKTNLCKEKGIQLIHIFEDEWVNKRQIVKSRLKHLLGKTKYRIGARKCIIKEINPQIKNKFLNKYHIQGEDRSSVKLGAFYKDRLVAVMTFGKQRCALGLKNKDNYFELCRFCTVSNFTIIGIGNKFLKYFKKNNKCEHIISYADIRWSNGNVYKKLGFKLSHVSKPNYWYMHKFNFLNRIHRFNFRKNVLKEKLDSFNDKLSERINMQNNDFTRIWDCGNLVFKIGLG